MRGPSLLWSFNGRINRARFWLGILLTSLIPLLAIATLVALETGSKGLGRAAENPVILLACVVWAIAFLAIHVKRLRDLDKSGWWVLLLFVPAVNLGLFIVCACIAGTVGPNAYDPEPSARKLEEALKSYRDDLAVRQRMVADDPLNMPLQRDVAVSHIKVATTCRQLGKVAEAQDELRKGRQVMLKVAAFAPGNEQWAKDLAGFDREIAELAAQERQTQTN